MQLPSNEISGEHAEKKFSVRDSGIFPGLPGSIAYRWLPGTYRQDFPVIKSGLNVLLSASVIIIIPSIDFFPQETRNMPDMRMDTADVTENIVPKRIMKISL